MIRNSNGWLILSGTFFSLGYMLRMDYLEI